MKSKNGSPTNDWPDLIDKALALAVQAHAGQRQKDGSAYIFHPLHLMGRLQEPFCQLAALLHDVVEDSEFTFADLEGLGLPAAVLAAVRLLTHDESVPYMEYVRRIKQDDIARPVKIADLEHNMDIRRLPALTDKDHQRLAKYQVAWQLLQAP